ncbi:hypothetical protein BDQ12DRAFT_718885 [Crucibulum laeve]|uniref:Uncharacterized protein n=1 Tax=Crucibulum laeve TaxID=68775 RepID=A0A5C3MEN5_9AGAR|nr:hypothetical protein BDQ12DRAFT_718885 [Crucibulum laeve]
MSSNNHNFLFASLDSKAPLTARKVHIRRLYDILQLCIQRKDPRRAKRAWAVLARCKEVRWSSMWKTGLLLLGENIDDELPSAPRKVEYLRTMMLHHTDERENILKELLFRLILLEKYREALDELELYLPSFPYQDNPVLHIYAGLISLFLSQSTAHDSISFDPIVLRDAQARFEHVKLLDDDNIVAQVFLDKVRFFYCIIPYFAYVTPS